MLTQFQRLKKEAKKKYFHFYGYKLTHRKLAEVLGTRETTISNCVHKKSGYIGQKFVYELQGIIACLDEQIYPNRHIQQSMTLQSTPQDTHIAENELWTCPVCHESHIVTDKNNTVCLNRFCRNCKVEMFVTPQNYTYPETRYSPEVSPSDTLTSRVLRHAGRRG